MNPSVRRQVRVNRNQLFFEGNCPDYAQKKGLARAVFAYNKTKCRPALCNSIYVLVDRLDLVDTSNLYVLDTGTWSDTSLERLDNCVTFSGSYSLSS